MADSGRDGTGTFGRRSVRQVVAGTTPAAGTGRSEVRYDSRRASETRDRTVVDATASVTPSVVPGGGV